MTKETLYPRSSRSYVVCALSDQYMAGDDCGRKSRSCYHSLADEDDPARAAFVEECWRKYKMAASKKERGK